jgi:hypothetical protein
LDLIIIHILDFCFLGSLGVGGSLGAENSLYAALRIGIGVKVGVEEDKK